MKCALWCEQRSLNALMISMMYIINIIYLYMETISYLMGNLIIIIKIIDKLD
jgi:hypothetical protein